MEREELQQFHFKSLFVSLNEKKIIYSLVCVGILVFGNIFFNNFIADDKSYILNNQEIRSFDLSKIFGPSIFNDGKYYRPIPALYFTLTYGMFHTNALPYHILQVVLHIFNSILIYRIFKTLLKKKVAFFSAILFLIHPMQVESVAYIAQSITPLNLLFGLLAVYYTVNPKINKNNTILVLLFLLLSMLTKETGILFVFLIGFYKVVFNRNKIKNFIGTALVAVSIYLLLRIVVGKIYFNPPMNAPFDALTLTQRLLDIPKVFLYYIQTFFAPINLIYLQKWQINQISLLDFYVPILIDCIFFGLIIIFGIYLFHHNKNNLKTYLFFVMWFFIGIGINLQIIPLDMTVADRWFYFPIVGLIGILAVVIGELLKKVTQIKLLYFFIIVIIILFGLLAIRTSIRNSNWFDFITLYNHDSKLQNNYDLENNFGIEYELIQDHNNALLHYKKSVEMYPYEQNMCNVGQAYENLGDFENAKKWCEAAFQNTNFRPYPHTHFLLNYGRLGIMYLIHDNPKKAVVLLQDAVKDYPDSSSLWVMYAVSEYYINNYDEALTASRKAYMLENNAQTYGTYMRILNKLPVRINNK